ncbi:hypothetical protein DFP72DRAFT_859000 [Ephemerocybe angulata]|uniref:Uncharacterized protein n=1 Tax=Ephemerocybe angulata TaxID=980116 RepID=A0A8H6HA63_9AGAR|nr:hypothetical protein DFP72DRAFT_859000 [Tulosesus angulatus]
MAQKQCSEVTQAHGKFDEGSLTSAFSARLPNQLEGWSEMDDLRDGRGVKSNLGLFQGGRDTERHELGVWFSLDDQQWDARASHGQTRSQLYGGSGSTLSEHTRVKPTAPRPSSRTGRPFMSLNWVRALCLSTEEQVRQAAFASAFGAAGFRVVSGYNDTARCGQYRKVIAEQEEGEDTRRRHNEGDGRKEEAGAATDAESLSFANLRNIGAPSRREDLFGL